MTQKAKIAVDAMGGDRGPEAVVAGIRLCNELPCDFLLVGDAPRLAALCGKYDLGEPRVEIVAAESVIDMEDKPSRILRNSQQSSMGKTISLVAAGRAVACVSLGNTGAQMVLGRKILGTLPNIDRPALAAIWPTPGGPVVFLDVGANVRASSEELAGFAVMGDALFRGMFEAKQAPLIGLVNVGAEKRKGHATLHKTAALLSSPLLGLDFGGFCEGNHLASGKYQVMVTDGFTGNVALKAAEGAAMQVSGYVKGLFTETVVSRFCAFLLRSNLARFRARATPARFNGAVFAGLRGVLVKSHGNATPEGVCGAIGIAHRLSVYGVLDNIKQRMEKLAAVEEEQTRKADTHEKAPENHAG